MPYVGVGLPPGAQHSWSWVYKGEWQRVASNKLFFDVKGQLFGYDFPLATVVTPNLPEAQALTGLDTEDRAALAERLVAMGAGAALVTGGHGATPADHLFDGRTHLAIPVARHAIAATPE